MGAGISTGISAGAPTSNRLYGGIGSARSGDPLLQDAYYKTDKTRTINADFHESTTHNATASDKSRTRKQHGPEKKNRRLSKQIRVLSMNNRDALSERHKE